MQIFIYSAAGNIIGISPLSECCTSPPYIPKDIDQLLVYSINQERVFVTIYNQDFSLASQCGNGLRALAYHLKQVLPFVVNNIQYSAFSIANDIWISMNLPLAHTEHVIDGIPYSLINIGNHHAVFDWAQQTNINLLKDRLPEYNLSFYYNRGTHLYIRTHERGSGWTGSCASACSAISYLAHRQSAHSYFICICPSGVLNVYCSQNSIYQTGPVKQIGRRDI